MIGKIKNYFICTGSYNKISGRPRLYRQWSSRILDGTVHTRITLNSKASDII